MEQSPQYVEVVDRDGWRFVYPIEKTIVHVGSDPRNDLVLDPNRGAGVAPRHIQIIHGLDGGGYRLVNLGHSDVVLGRSVDALTDVLAPHSVLDVGDQSHVRLGEFDLIFRDGPGRSLAAVGNSAGPLVRQGASRSLGLQLTLPQTTLGPEGTIDATLLVRNLGDADGVQFDLALVGLSPEVYELDPAPILFSEGEGEVSLRLRHTRAPTPTAGEYAFTIRATAAGSYPGESAQVTGVIDILPYYRHHLQCLTPKSQR